MHHTNERLSIVEVSEEPEEPVLAGNISTLFVKEICEAYWDNDRFVIRYDQHDGTRSITAYVQRNMFAEQVDYE